MIFCLLVINIINVVFNFKLIFLYYLFNLVVFKLKYIGIEVDFILIFFGGIFVEGILFMF